MARAAIRASILSSMKSTKVSTHGPSAGTLRTPAGVLANEVNPLKRLEKGFEKIPAGARNKSKFAG